MDWVHCNICVIQPGEVEKKKFFITSCGHIYCDDCFQPDSANECRMCQSKCNTIPLSSNMSSEIEIFFHDPLPNFKKHMRILEFQHSHRLRLISFYREKLRNYKVMKKENLNLKEELKLYKEENGRLREEMKRLKMDFNEFKRRQGVRLSSDNTETRQGTHTFSQFICKDSPKSATKSSLEDSFPSGLKRTSESNFFFVTEKKPASQTLKKDKVFTPPNLPKCPGDYRSRRMSMSDESTPSTSETISKRLRNKNPLQRRINLPIGLSPVSKLGFHGLHLSIPTSTPKKECGLYDKFRKRCN